MKIAIAVSGKDLDSQVDPRFGRCPNFLVVDSGTEKFEVLENTAGKSFRGAGITAAQMIANKKVGAAIAGNFGPNAVNVLSTSGIKIFAGVSGSAKEALKNFKGGKLEEITKATAVPFGQRRGRGRNQ